MRLSLQHLEEQLNEAAGRLDFEAAAKLRDQLLALRGEKIADNTPAGRRSSRKRRRK